MPLEASPPTLPDLLPRGLDVVFVGINPGLHSARRGHYYGHPGNAFWRMLGASPLVARPVTPEDDAALATAPAGGARIGFTDVVKRVLTDSTGITAAELATAAPAFRARIAAAAPRAVCFTATRPFLALYPKAWRARGWGRQNVPSFEGAPAEMQVWVMPSTSGRAAAYHGRITGVLADLAASLGRSRNASTPAPALPPRGAAGRRTIA